MFYIIYNYLRDKKATLEKITLIIFNLKICKSNNKLKSQERVFNTTPLLYKNLTPTLTGLKILNIRLLKISFLV